MSAASNSTVTLPFLPLLTLLFIGLKLTSYITWSWLWILSPMWIPLSVLLFFVLIGVIVKVWSDA
jgi:hypothetical protein